MGKIVTIEYVDDLDEVPVSPDTVDTVDFSYRGQDYTLVLTNKNGAQFDKDMARYIKAAKKAQARDARTARNNARPGPRQSKSTKPKAATASKAAAKSAPRRASASRKPTAVGPTDPGRNRAIRAWAVANGHTVSKRGRIPEAVLDAYNAEH